MERLRHSMQRLAVVVIASWLMLLSLNFRCVLGSFFPNTLFCICSWTSRFVTRCNSDVTRYVTHLFFT